MDDTVAQIKWRQVKLYLDMIVILEEVALGKAIRDQVEVIIIRSVVASIILVMCLGEKFILIINHKSVFISKIGLINILAKMNLFLPVNLLVTYLLPSITRDRRDRYKCVYIQCTKDSIYLFS